MAMVKVEGNGFWKDGSKIGYIDDNYIKNNNGDKVGYYQDNYINDAGGRKVAYLDGTYISFYDSSKKIRIEDNEKEISGGDLSDIQKAAVRVLLVETAE